MLGTPVNYWKIGAKLLNSLCVLLEYIDDNIIEKQPTNRLGNQVSELNNIETKSHFYTHENVLDSVECSRKI